MNIRWNMWIIPLMLVMTLGTLVSLSPDVQGQGLQPPSKGGPDDEINKRREVVVPPKPLPDCPSDFADTSGLAFGTGSTDSDYYIEALGEALLECDMDLQGEKQEQDAEVLANKTKCHAVEGCVFSYTLTYEACTGDATDCKPLSGDKGPFTCTVSGNYDPENYKCERPPAEPASSS